MIISFLIVATAFTILIIIAPSVEDLRYELSEWMRIGISDDIIRMPDHRQEYKVFLDQVSANNKNKNLSTDETVTAVLGLIEQECKVPRLSRFKRQSFWHLFVVSSIKTKKKILAKL